MNNPQSLPKNYYLALNTVVIGILTLVLAITPDAQGHKEVHCSYGGVNNSPQWVNSSPELATCKRAYNQSPK